MTTVGHVIEFDGMPTRAQGVLRWIARCSMHDDAPSGALVPRIEELQCSQATDGWGLTRWSAELGYRGGPSIAPGGYVRKALVMAGIDRFDRGPLVYRWDFSAGKYRLVNPEVRRG